MVIWLFMLCATVPAGSVAAVRAPAPATSHGQRLRSRTALLQLGCATAAVLAVRLRRWKVLCYYHHSSAPNSLAALAAVQSGANQLRANLEPFVVGAAPPELAGDVGAKELELAV